MTGVPSALFAAWAAIALEDKRTYVAAIASSFDGNTTMTTEADSALKALVLAELAWEPSVRAAHMGVIAHDGVITLSGSVEGFAAKHGAQSAALRVNGVRAVSEEIEVKLPFDINRSDEEIARAAADRLAWDSMLPKDAVTVAVRGGWITLTGEVAWRYEHDAAAQDVLRLWGVAGVSNQITVKPRIDTLSLTSEISSALHRAWFEHSGIEVTAEGGSVTLAGHVKSWSEREMAGDAAWAAPGVADVQNHLTVL